MKHTQHTTHNTQLKKAGYILITLLYMIIISYLSLRPVSQGYHGSIPRQAVFNFLHIPAYGLLFYMILRSFSSAGMRVYLFSFTIAVLFGAINEYLQSFVPGRQASVWDILINIAGVLVVMGGCRVWGVGFRVQGTGERR